MSGHVCIDIQWRPQRMQRRFLRVQQWIDIIRSEIVNLENTVKDQIVKINDVTFQS